MITFHPSNTYLERYLSEAPAALALERTAECALLSKHAFVAPVIDIGCGDGIFVDILFRDQIDLGVDINPLEIEVAQRTGKYKQLLACPASDIPVPDAAFNTAFSNSVMEHIPDLPPVLAETNRVLAKGGALYLTLPTSEFARGAIAYRLLQALGSTRLSASYEAFYNRFWHHYNYHSVEDWRRLFKRHGFEVEDAHVYGSRQMCSINDGLAYAAFTSLVAKKLLNRWFFFPGWRRASAPLWRRLFGPVVVAEAERPGYGLVFFKLRKVGSPQAGHR